MEQRGRREWNGTEGEEGMEWNRGRGGNGMEQRGRREWNGTEGEEGMEWNEEEYGQG